MLKFDHFFVKKNLTSIINHFQDIRVRIFRKPGGNVTKLCFPKLSIAIIRCLFINFFLLFYCKHYIFTSAGNKNYSVKNIVISSQILFRIYLIYFQNWNFYIVYKCIDNHLYFPITVVYC